MNGLFVFWFIFIIAGGGRMVVVGGLDRGRGHGGCGWWWWWSGLSSRRHRPLAYIGWGRRSGGVKVRKEVWLYCEVLKQQIIAMSSKVQMSYVL